MDKPYVVGVDIGGQTTKIGIVDRRGEIVAQTVITSKYGADEGEKFMDSVCDTIENLAKGVGMDQIQGVGIGAPNGNYYTGEIAFAPNLPWAKNGAVPLKVTPGFFKKDKKKFLSETLRSCKNSVYEHVGKVVGVVSSSADYIEGLFVLPEFWGKGIGTELLNSATIGKDEIFLQVYADNERAVNFYRKNGFEISGSGVCQMTRLPYFEMRKTLR